MSDVMYRVIMREKARANKKVREIGGKNRIM